MTRIGPTSGDSVAVPADRGIVKRHTTKAAMKFRRIVGPCADWRPQNTEADHCDPEGGPGECLAGGAIPGISDATFYNRRKKASGLEVSEDNRLQALEEENGQLKALNAETRTNCSRTRRTSLSSDCITARGAAAGSPPGCDPRLRKN